MRPEISARRLGRLSALERVASLFDDGHAGLADAHHDVEESDGLILRVGLVQGREVLAIGTDRRVHRGTLGVRVATTMESALEDARERGLPVVLLLDSDGVRMEEGAPSVFAVGRVLGALASISGYVPTLAVVFGIASGAAAYAVALCDLAIAVSGRSFAFVTGPGVVRAAIGEDASMDALGGTRVHGAESGLLHATAVDDRAATSLARQMLSYLPSSASTLPLRAAPAEPAARCDLERILHIDRRFAYDIEDVLTQLVDAGSLLPLASSFGPSIEVAFARIDGRAVALVASRPRSAAGALDAAASQKLARFVRLAGAFNLPVVTLADTPGFMPGVRSERARILVHGAKVIAAYAEAKRTVPTIALILRRAVGAGSVLALGADILYALPGYELLAMGEDAVRNVDDAYLGEATPTSREVLVVDPAAVREVLVSALENAPAVVPSARGERKYGLVPL